MTRLFYDKEPLNHRDLVFEFSELIEGVRDRGLKGKEYWFKYLAENGESIFIEIRQKLAVYEQFALTIGKLETLLDALKSTSLLKGEANGLSIALNHLRDCQADVMLSENLSELKRLKTMIGDREGYTMKDIVADKQNLDGALDYIYESATSKDLEDIQEALDTMKKSKLIDKARGE